MCSRNSQLEEMQRVWCGEGCRHGSFLSPSEHPSSQNPDTFTKFKLPELQCLGVCVKLPLR